MTPSFFLKLHGNIISYTLTLYTTIFLDPTFDKEDKGEDRLLTAKNKWLIAHEDAQIEGAFCGLQGENVEV